MVEERVEPVAGPPRRMAPSPPQPIREISLSREIRLKSEILEFDRTLGGGLVPGSLVLIGGDPGIGKSTLILQVLDRLCQKVPTGLYCSGEESPQQIKLRAERIGIQSAGLYVVSATSVEDLFKTMEDLKPDVLVIDSIQTFYTESLSSAPGSVAQVREVASRFLSFAKGSGVPVFLIGHVTKEGAIAGPKVLEHLVDTVLYFEGDRGHVFRILRAVKNRYGATNEIGVFEMKESGLAEVGNPSRIFLQERPKEVSGSVVIPCLEGTRPVLVEIQALVGTEPLRDAEKDGHRRRPPSDLSTGCGPGKTHGYGDGGPGYLCECCRRPDGGRAGRGLGHRLGHDVELSRKTRSAGFGGLWRSGACR